MNLNKLKVLNIRTQQVKSWCLFINIGLNSSVLHVMIYNWALIKIKNKINKKKIKKMTCSIISG